jgi:hypothetical protein
MKWVPNDRPSKLSSFLTGVPASLFLVTVATILLFVSLWWWLPKPFTLIVPIQTSRAVQLKLYYAGGDSGFREDRATVRFADSRATFNNVQLPIPRSNLRALRLHVSPGAMVEFGQLVLAPLGRAAIPISPSDISVVNNSCKVEQLGAITRFYTAADSDGFDLDLHSSQLPLSNARRLEGAAVILLCCFLATSVWLVTRSQQTNALATRPGLLRDRLSPRACRRIVLALTLIFVLATILKLNGSSSSIWRFYADGRLPDRDLLLGSAKDIRSDEWMVQTPWILSQALNEPPFPTTNPNVGDGATALLTNLPIRHWTTIFRPQFWSFFVFDIEHAFAWYWNLKWYVLIVGGFLFFRLVSNANTLATAAGTILVFFAPYIQWWYSTGAALPEIVGLTFIGLWSLRCLLRASSVFAITGSAIVLLIATENFIFCCYPRFQIPLLYFAALVAGWLFLTSPPRRRYRICRWSGIFAVIALVGFCGWAWYREVAPTLQMTAQLEYPGKIFSVGGGFSWVQFLVPFLQFGMTEFHYPNGLVNACNAAGFMLILPFITALLVSRRVASRDLLVILMLGFIVAVGYFMMAGVPAALAKYSGWSLVYSTRGILPVGIASIVCFVRLLSGMGRPRTTGLGVAAIATVVLGVGFWLILSVVNRRYEEFVSTPMVVAVSAYLAVAMVMLFANRRAIAVGLLLAPVVAAGAWINPIGRGLPGFYRSETYRWLQSFTSKHHQERWLVIGSDSRSSYLPYLVKAAGGDVLNGIRCNPDMRVFSIVDPQKQHFDVWNRFAIVSYVASKDDKIGLTLTSGVSYTVAIPFKTDLLDRLGVRYILNVDSPAGEADIPGFRTKAERDGLVLRIREGP